MWVRACRLDELGDGEAVRLDRDPPVAVFKSEGELFATADTCTHGLASLSQGFVESGTVECPSHFAVFSLRTGEVLEPPATRPIATFQTKVEDGVIYVEVGEPSSAAATESSRSSR
jgi:3-phenylpropionate/trans-cinnamate dioxygenase ferredoxin component